MTRLSMLIAGLGLATLPLASGFPAGAVEVRHQPQTVVELFTSQGCSRCPDADRLLAEFGERDDIVALAYHVDYWDYIGWQDTFALPANTALQKAYAQSWGKNRIYTPQMVINGAQAVVGSDEREAEAAIAGASTPLALDLRVDGETRVTLSAQGDASLSPAVVWLVTYRDLAEVAVERGENSGQLLAYSHIVTGRQAIGMWDPETGAEISIPLDEVLGSHSDGAAVIVQERQSNLPGRIIGASAFHR